MHAVKYNHLQHHKHCLGKDDVEGSSARMKWWQAILLGPLFPVKLNTNAFRNGNNSLKRWVISENIFVFIFIGISFWSGNNILIFHTCAMLAGECLTAFFAVWTVHHDCDNDTHFSGTQRGKFIPKMFYNMFYHTEHHLFPKVPTCHLPELAKRIEKEIPEISLKKVF
jgi:fatty acid desaturase